jgi:hypothetical protein
VLVAEDRDALHAVVLAVAIGGAISYLYSLISEAWLTADYDEIQTGYIRF